MIVYDYSWDEFDIGYFILTEGGGNSQGIVLKL